MYGMVTVSVESLNVCAVLGSSSWTTAPPSRIIVFTAGGSDIGVVKSSKQATRSDLLFARKFPWSDDMEDFHA